MTEAQQIAAAGKHGIKDAALVHEVWSNRTPKPTGYDFALMCAFLMQETGGGANVFGHDPTIFVGAGVVTEAKYLAYRTLRNRVHKYQGVGAMQLTWYSYQDKADALDGCWDPRSNMHVGFVLARDNILKYGLFAGVAAYNGSGSAAIAYARSVLSIRQTFEHYLSVEEPDFKHLETLALYVPTAEDLAAFYQAERDLTEMLDDDPSYLPH